MSRHRGRAQAATECPWCCPGSGAEADTVVIGERGQAADLVASKLVSDFEGAERPLLVVSRPLGRPIPFFIYCGGTSVLNLVPSSPTSAS